MNFAIIYFIINNFVGTIAEREHLKWQQAPPLPNNPYSKENIEHRKHKNSALLNIHSSDEQSV